MAFPPINFTNQLVPADNLTATDVKLSRPAEVIRQVIADWIRGHFTKLHSLEVK